MLVWLASYPRSGNSFARRALNAIYGSRTASIYDADYAPVSRLSESTHLESALKEVDSWPEIVFVKTHELPSEEHRPAIYLVRDGRDSLVSYSWFDLQCHQGMTLERIDAKAFRAVLRRHIVRKRTRFGDWSDNVEAWTTRQNTVVVRFEDLILNAKETVVHAVNQLGLQLDMTSSPEIPSFQELNANCPQLYRRGEVGSWKDEFPPDLLELFWQRHGELMKRFGYQRDQHEPPRHSG